MEEHSEPFEFDDLDALWDEVKDLNPNESREVRHVTQGAQGVIGRIEDDERFGLFPCSRAQYHNGGSRDSRLFTINRVSLCEVLRQGLSTAMPCFDCKEGNTFVVHEHGSIAVSCHDCIKTITVVEDLLIENERRCLKRLESRDCT